MGSLEIDLCKIFTYFWKLTWSVVLIRSRTFIEYSSFFYLFQAPPLQILPSCNKYCAPERFDSSKSSSWAASWDVWGLGCLIWEVLQWGLSCYGEPHQAGRYCQDSPANVRGVCRCQSCQETKSFRSR